MSLECIKCKSACAPKEKGLQENEIFGCPCDCCKNMICKNCSKMTTTEVRTMILANRTMFYFCDTCSETIKLLPVFKNKMPQLESDIKKLKEISAQIPKVDEIKSEIVQIKKDIEQLKNSSSTALSYADVVSNLNKDTKMMKSSIDEITNKIKSSEDNIKAGALSQPAVEPTLLEMQEREIRASNALVFGAEEAGTGNTEEQRAHDAQIVKDILNCVCGDQRAETIMVQLKIIRLGKYDPNKQRPIKIVFPSKEEARKMLVNKNKLPKESGKYIKYDLTSMQRTYLKNLLEEMQQRTEKGEANLKIKYMNGTPKIIKYRLASDHEITDADNSKN